MRQVCLGVSVAALIIVFAWAVFSALSPRHGSSGNQSSAVVSAGENVSGSTLELRESVRIPNGQGHLYKYCDTEVKKWVYVVNGNAVATPAARSCR